MVMTMVFADGWDTYSRHCDVGPSKHVSAGFLLADFLIGHFDLKRIKGVRNSHQYTEIVLKFGNAWDFQNFNRIMSWNLGK